MFTEIMLNMMRYADETQKWIKAAPSNTIKHIFKLKANLHVFITMVLKQIGKDILYANRHTVAIVGALTTLYVAKYKGAIPFKPLIELQNYVYMLSVERNDWQRLKEVTAVGIADPKTATMLFYRLLNEIGALAVKDSISIQSAYLNQHEWDRLKHSAALNDESEDHWLTSMFSDFNYAEFIEMQYKESKYTDALAKEQKVGTDNTYGPIYNRNAKDNASTTVRDSARPTKRMLREKAKQGIYDWLKQSPTSLLPKWRKKFGDGRSYCAPKHMSNKECSAKGDKCKYGKFERSHICLCGSNTHEMHECTTIWQ